MDIFSNFYLCLPLAKVLMFLSATLPPPDAKLVIGMFNLCATWPQFLQNWVYVSLRMYVHSLECDLGPTSLAKFFTGEKINGGQVAYGGQQLVPCSP
jgi:hypothetical protein